MLKKSLAILIAAALVVAMIAPTFAATNPFADVPYDHWAYQAVAEIAEAGLVIGYPDGTFGGERFATRYEMAMVTARMLAKVEAMIQAEVDKKVKAGIDTAKPEIKAELSKEASDMVVAELEKALAAIEAAKAEADAAAKAELEKAQADLLSQLDAYKAALAAKVDEAVAGIEVPEREVVVERVVEKPVVTEKVVVEKPIETTMTVEKPFEMTPEASAIIAKYVEQLVSQKLEQQKPAERVVETKIIREVVKDPEMTKEEIETLVDNATTEANFYTGVATKEAERARKEAQAALEAADAAAKAAAEAHAAADAAAAEAGFYANVANAEAQRARDVAEAAAKAAEEADRKALEARKEAIAAQAAAAAVDDRVDTLDVQLAAVRGDVDAVNALIEAKTAQLSRDIEKLAAEFEQELNSLGVRVADLETVFVNLEKRVADLELAQAATQAELAQHKAEHEKVKITGTAKVELEDVATTGGTAYKDPNDKDIDDDDDPDIYEAGSSFDQEYSLVLTARPADNVEVSAGMTVSNALNDDTEDQNLEDMFLELTTDGALKKLRVGSIPEQNWSDLTLAEYSNDDDLKEGLYTELQLNPSLSSVAVLERWDDATTPEYLFASKLDWKLNDQFSLTAALINEVDGYLTSKDSWANGARRTAIGGELVLGEVTTVSGELASDGSGAEDKAMQLDLATKVGVVDLGFNYERIGTTFVNGEYGDPNEPNLTRKLSAELPLPVFGGTASAYYKMATDLVTSVDSTVSAVKVVKDGMEFLGAPLALEGGYALLKKEDSQPDLKVAYGVATLGEFKVLGDVGMTVTGSMRRNNTDFDDEDEWEFDKDEDALDTDLKWQLTDALLLTAGYKWAVNPTTDIVTRTGEVGGQYTLELGSIDLVPGFSYKQVNEDNQPLKKVTELSVGATTEFLGAAVEANYKWVKGQGGTDIDDAPYDGTDTILDGKLTYPIYEGVDFEVLGKYINSENVNSADSYTASEFKAGLAVSF